MKKYLGLSFYVLLSNNHLPSKHQNIINPKGLTVVRKDIISISS